MAREKHSELEKYQKALSDAVRAINESDVELTPKEQAALIKTLGGMTAREMEKLTKMFFDSDGPELADSIRKLISPFRATDRTTKDTKGRK